MTIRGFVIRSVTDEDVEVYAITACARCDVALGEGDTVILRPEPIGDGKYAAMAVYCSTPCLKNKRTADWNQAIDSVTRVLRVEQASCDVDSDYQRGRSTALGDAIRLAEGEKLDD